MSITTHCYDGVAKQRIIDAYPHYIHTVICKHGVQVRLSQAEGRRTKDITHCDAETFHTWLYQ